MRFPSARSCDWGVTSYLYSISEIHRVPRNFSTASAGNPHPGLVLLDTTLCLSALRGLDLLLAEEQIAGKTSQIDTVL
jgi:hypothetical protein